jgi:flagellar M-ring protein FliF
MEPLLLQARKLPQQFGALPGVLRLVLLVAVLAGIGVAAFTAVQGNEAWQYAFTNLTPEDSSEAAAALKAAQIPFRLDAGGSALAVPGPKVYDARLLLAAAGLPRGGGVGFEIFDRGDLGVSEFTQRVNLRRATEGELARTIGRLAQVRSARVHLTLPEKGLFRDEDRKASAAVVLGLQPGRRLDEREIAGVRHLVASAVPGLSPAMVTVVDGRGTVLAADSAWNEAQGWQKRLEADLERRVVDILEQAVGQGAVVARVTANVDASEISTQSEQVDPDATAVKSERRQSTNQSQDSSTVQGIAGAAANQPQQPQAPMAQGPVNRGNSASQDEVKNYEVSHTTTQTVNKVPRLRRLSVAVLVDGVGGKARPDAEVARLGELAKRAVGFDAARGDVIDISSAPFARVEESAAAGTSATTGASAGPTSPLAAIPEKWLYIGGAAAALVLLAIGFFLARSLFGRGSGSSQDDPGGQRLSELNAGMVALSQAMGPAGALPGLAGDPSLSMRDRARLLAEKDPGRAAHILKAWMQNDPKTGVTNG